MVSRRDGETGRANRSGEVGREERRDGGGGGDGVDGGVVRRLGQRGAQRADQADQAELDGAVHGQGLLGRVCRGARGDDDAALGSLVAEGAEGQFDAVDDGAEVDVHDVVGGLEEVAIVVERVCKIVGFFRNAGVGHCDVDVADSLECLA